MGTENDNFYYTMPEVPRDRGYLVQELRRMAAAEGGYTRFTYMSPWIKNIWVNAAALLEKDAAGKAEQAHD